MVDFVVMFDEETPHELIKAIKPNILINSSDYHGGEVIGQDIVDEIKSYGLDIDVVVEAKAKELTVLKYQKKYSESKELVDQV